MNKENDVQTLSVNAMVLIIFPDTAYFALEFMHLCISPWLFLILMLQNAEEHECLWDSNTA